jgi:hypothetical protein
MWRSTDATAGKALAAAQQQVFTHNGKESPGMSARIMELTFNSCYLLVIYALVVLMTRKLAGAAETAEKDVFRLVRNAFLLLALGDTGHVGFRVLAYTVASLQETVRFAGFEFTLVGLGNLTTAVTVTVFYMLLLEIWRRRFDQEFTFPYCLLMAAGVLRLALFPFSGNQWGSAVPPLEWSLVRNAPLVVQGMVLGALIMRDSLRSRDRTFYLVSLMIFLSYAFYLPVILCVQKVPQIGMLMIPKTCAYLAVAYIGYTRLCNESEEDCGLALETDPA